MALHLFYCTNTVYALTTSLFTAIGLLILPSCQNNHFLKEEKNIGKGSWAHDDVLKWQFEVNDSATVFNLLLDVYHADTFPYQNLYLKLKMTHPDGKQIVRTTSFLLFDSAGEPLGKRSKGMLLTRLTLQPDAYFARPGLYGLEIEQFMRSQHIPVQAVSLVIEKTAQRR